MDRPAEAIPAQGVSILCHQGHDHCRARTMFGRSVRGHLGLCRRGAGIAQFRQIAPARRSHPKHGTRQIVADPHQETESRGNRSPPAHRRRFVGECRNVRWRRLHRFPHRDGTRPRIEDVRAITRCRKGTSRSQSDLLECGPHPGDRRCQQKNAPSDRCKSGQNQRSPRRRIPSRYQPGR